MACRARAARPYFRRRNLDPERMSVTRKGDKRAAAPLRRRHRPDVRLRGHDVVDVLLRFLRIALGVKTDVEAVHRECVDVAQSEVSEVSDLLAVEPERDAAVALSGCVGFHHELVAVPAVE